MWTSYFPNSGMADFIHQTPAEPYLDGFVAALISAGYRPGTIRRYLRSAAYFSYWLRGRGRLLADLEKANVDEFKEHLRACECERFKRVNDYDLRGASAFLRHLQATSAVPVVEQAATRPTMPPLFLQFCEWMRRHHGMPDTTLNTYRRTIVDVLQTLGSNPRDFAIADLRAFVLDRASRHGRSQARVVITALRAFIRFLIAQGQCQVGLDVAIPTIGGWRLSALPRYLPPADVERVLAACDSATVTGARDRAILLLLARLGLRASDIYALRLGDIDWAQATVQVLGKSRRMVQLPLPQQVGDAIAHYLATARPAVRSDHLFLRVASPVGPFPTNSTAVSAIVKSAIHRAGVSAPSHGAHLLRHSAATALLAEGASLESIAVLLRHRSLDTTAHYAKVDVRLLRELAQPWPEVSPC
ncbi:tyrosine-type recombinase/integrase [Cupriavidus sp. UYPR2.512]|uniref:tyrosine-type recombinase/integrase n=1 Tax=Cupriavidus sp. UYPR2.512 TaxID=1080187 RepID=UPI0012FCAE09|nr:tyrosine-type recombinase/integrase [Cupriavidus sp. UYPR2.512]UIF88259.1 tyrosine-type recombinase/integrase [Cupriavidus necator]